MPTVNYQNNIFVIRIIINTFVSYESHCYICTPGLLGKVSGF